MDWFRHIVRCCRIEASDLRQFSTTLQDPRGAPQQGPPSSGCVTSVPGGTVSTVSVGQPSQSRRPAPLSPGVTSVLPGVPGLGHERDVGLL